METHKENRRCRYCDDRIPETRNKGALYCCDQHGWTFRNNNNAEERAKIRASEPGLYKNRKILKDLIDKGISEISKKTASCLGFDFNCFTGIIKTDPLLKTTEYKLFEYSFTVFGDLIKIKKIVI